MPSHLIHLELPSQLGLAVVLHHHVPGVLVQVEHVQEGAAAKVPGERPERVGPVQEDDCVAGGQEMLRRA